MLLAGLGQISDAAQLCLWPVAAEGLHKGEAALSSSHLFRAQASSGCAERRLGQGERLWAALWARNRQPNLAGEMFLCRLPWGRCCVKCCWVRTQEQQQSWALGGVCCRLSWSGLALRFQSGEKSSRKASVAALPPCTQLSAVQILSVFL